MTYIFKEKTQLRVRLRLFYVLKNLAAGERKAQEINTPGSGSDGFYPGSKNEFC